MSNTTETPQAVKKTIRMLPGEQREQVTEVKEQLLLNGQPLAVFKLSSGAEVGVHPKPKGYFYLIEQAVNEYIETMVEYDIAISPMQHFRFLRRRWPLNLLRKRRQRKSVLEIEAASYRLICLIFDNKYDPERHSEISNTDYYAMPHDMFVAILEAYRKANNVDVILSKLIPDWDSKKKSRPGWETKQGFTVQ